MDAMNGLIILLKVPGMTSHDATSAVRRLCGGVKAGHAGTLDPGAAGVLPVLLGKGTRLLPYLPEEKSYRVEMTLGIVTDTGDAAGDTVAVNETAVTAKQLAEAFAAHLGAIWQEPPMTSAVRIGGRRLYELARRGEEIDRPLRQVFIKEMHIRSAWPKNVDIFGMGARVLFDVTCSSGTYIRTLCADIGKALGCGAHMSFLLRTAAAGFRLEQAVTLEELSAAAEERRLHKYLIPLDGALQHYPQVRLNTAMAEDLRCGRPLYLKQPAAGAGLLRAYDMAGRFLALIKPGPEPDCWVTERYFGM